MTDEMQTEFEKRYPGAANHRDLNATSSFPYDPITMQLYMAFRDGYTAGIQRAMRELTT